jgi:hypothetical protein
LPTVTATAASNAICNGSTDVLTASGAANYMWSSGGNAPTETVSPSSTSTYTVTGTDMNGCMNTATVMVTVNPLPTVALGSDVTQCGGTVTFDAQNVGSTYLWSDASTNQMLTVSTSGTYSVTVTDANGCMNSDVVMATINAIPTVALGADITQCGGTATLNAQNAGSTYLWNNGSTTQTISVSSTGNYFVDVTDGNGCMGSDTIMVTINTIPTVTGTAASTTVCLNDAAVALTGTPVGGAWSGPGVSGSLFTPLTAGNGAQTITYTYSDVNNCSNTATVVITVNACVGVAEESLLNGVSVYPNPNNGVFTLAVNANVGEMNIVITDLQGRVVYSSTENNVSTGFTQQINLQTEATGMYIMQITANGEQRLEKISVQK